MKRKDEPPRDPTAIGETATRLPGTPKHAVSVGMPAAIGEYRILRKLGEGGMGVVYEAEQPSLHRTVALKVIHGGATADEHRLRMFEREAETLARLRHPNIGAIHEAGRSADGQPFLVMEKVEGRPLDAYLTCRHEVVDRVEVEFRLLLFLKLCGAVSYAHQRGVIHRDLKPANILVEESADGKPAIKVLDFGLARIVAEGSPTATVATEVGAIKGTLYYMSPEQARGDSRGVDVRADVYALGVILFEMLTGGRPLDLREQSLVDAVRSICDKPPARLKETWAGPERPDEDLETIVAKALEKDVERRYPSVAAFADDVERHLTSRPILARPPSNSYLLRKFARRNKVLVGGVVTTVTVLIAGIAVSTVFGLSEARQRRAAEAARDDLETVVQFQSNMIGQVDPERAGERILAALRERIDRSAEAQPSQGAAHERLAALDSALGDINPTDLARDVLRQNILEPAAVTVESDFAERPLIEARLEHSIGSTYRGLGMYDKALPHAEKAARLFRQELGEAHMETLKAEESLAKLCWDRGEYDRAEALLRQVLAHLAGTLGLDDPQVLTTRADLAALRWARGDADAESQYLAILAARRRLFGDDNVDTASTMDNLGVIYFQQGRYENALPLWTEALDIRRRLIGAEDPQTLSTMTNLAALSSATGHLERARALYDEALEIQRRTLGDDDPRTLATQNNLAMLYQAQGLHGRETELQRRTLAARQRVLGKRNPETLRSMNNLAMALMHTGSTAEARGLLEELATLDREVQPGSASQAMHLHSLGELLLSEGDLSAAELTILRALEIYDRTSHRYTGLALYQLGGLAAREGRHHDALAYLRRARDRGYDQWDADAPELSSLRGDPEFESLLEGEQTVPETDREEIRETPGGEPRKARG